MVPRVTRIPRPPKEAALAAGRKRKANQRHSTAATYGKNEEAREQASGAAARTEARMEAAVGIFGETCLEAKSPSSMPPDICMNTARKQIIMR